MSTLFVNKLKAAVGSLITSNHNIKVEGYVTQTAIPHVFFQGGKEDNTTVSNNEHFGSTDAGQAAFKTDGTALSSIQGGITYNSATGEFTVPIDGIYHIFCQVYLNQDGATARIGGFINDTQRFMGHGGYGAGGGPDNRGTHSAEAVIKLSAGDKIHFENNSGGNRTFYEGVNHHYGYIYLVG